MTLFTDSMYMSEDQFDRQPKYVQSHISLLERKIERLEAELKSVSGGNTEGRMEVHPQGFVTANPYRLGDYAQVLIDDAIRVSLSEDRHGQHVQIMVINGQRLTVRPQSSNVLHITAED